ncbi:MAG: UDP-N-acetylmuramoyl-L-alanine--D-glutamate ligase [Gammaproteobacteria bacterium]|nr:UDP-N-acetylmuramoyl-L-alanine--D-glutamate ligase [Gammaproteobacteria bacterium]
MAENWSEGKTLVVGLGKTGLSCARYLAALNIPAAVIDSRIEPPGLEQLREELPDIAVFLGGFDPAVFGAAERLVVSPGVPLSEPLIKEAAARGVEILGDIELFAGAVSAPVVAITGSNGKSTVTSLLADMAVVAGKQAGAGGNLGEPALDILAADNELYLLELSSFQLETTRSLHPESAVVLNLSPDHLDRYDDIDDYAAVKARVYEGARSRVFNLDDPRVMAMRRGEGRDFFFTLSEPSGSEFGLRQVAGETWLARGQERLIEASAVRIAGRHNHANALAALAIGASLDLPMSGMLESLTRYPGLPHRSQFVAEVDGVRWYNDSKGTNPGACAAALEGLHVPGHGARTVLIAGGDGKGADFSPLAPVVRDTARAVILMGRDAELIAQALENTVPLLQAKGMNEAVQMAAEQALPGDRVLLSPACASFDMFRNYGHRGDVFMATVGRLYS